MRHLYKLLILSFISLLINLSAQAQTNIVGGEVAEPEAFPWMVTLINDWGTQGCGATLIDAHWVLTAAHCIPDFDGAPENIQVLINSVVTNPGNAEPYTELIDIEEIFVYPSWDWFIGQPDLALIRLAEPALTEPVQLATYDDMDMFAHDMPAIVLGWGLTETGGQDADSLRVGYTRFVEMSECLNLYESSLSFPGMEIHADSLICAALVNEDLGVVGSALGDSGGPLLYENGGILKQVGVVSFGESDVTLEEYPGVFTLIPPFLSWIDSTMAAYEPTSTTTLNKEGLRVTYYANEKIVISDLNPEHNYGLIVYSISGAQMFRFNSSHQEEERIDVLPLETGIYMLEVFDETNGQSNRMKFFVSR